MIPRTSPIWAGNSQPIFHLGLSASLVPQRASSATPTFTRATTAYVLGYAAAAVIADGPVYILCASGEARFMGARRVSQGVWSTTDANGVALTTGNGASALCCDASGPFGYLAEGARADVLGTTNEIRRTMTDVGWVVGATMTVGSATGADGVASAGASLTGGAVTATNTVLFTTVLGSAARTFSALIRRKTGTGTIEMTDNGGTNWTDITSTLTTAYKQFQVTRTQANPIVGFRITTDTDAIEVDFNTIEAASFANPTPIPVNVSKAADVLTYPVSGNISGTVGSSYAEVAIFSGSGVRQMIGLQAGQDSAMYRTNTFNLLALYDGTNSRAGTEIVAGPSVNKFATSWSGAVSNIANNGVNTASTFDGAMTTNALYIGGSNANDLLFGTIRNVRIYPVALDPGRLISLTT